MNKGIRCLLSALVVCLSCTGGGQDRPRNGDRYDDLIALEKQYAEMQWSRGLREVQDSVQRHWEELSERQKSKACQAALEARTAAGDSSGLAPLVTQYRTLTPTAHTDWLLLSKAYEILDLPGRTLEALGRVRWRRLPLDGQITLLLRRFRAEEALGRSGAVNQTYKRYVRARERMRLLDSNAQIRMAAEEAQARQENWQRRRWRVAWIAAFLLLVSASLAGIREIRRRSRREQEDHRLQLAALQREAGQARREAAQWKLLLEKEQVPPEVKELVSGRIEALNRYALQKLSRQDKRAAASLENTISHYNREEFARDLRMQFRYLHPDLADYLEGKNLSEQEMTCCTLLLLGCQTKEIASQMNLSAQRCYNIFNTVRRKLGLREDRRTLYTILSERIR